MWVPIHYVKRMLKENNDNKSGKRKQASNKTKGSKFILKTLMMNYH